MKPVTLEWVEKAEGDFATAQRELRARKTANGESADKDEARNALKLCKQIRAAIRQSLGLEP